MIDSECVNLARWGGLPVFSLPGSDFEEMADWPGGVGIPADVEAWAWCVSVSGWDGLSHSTMFEAFLRDVDPARVGAFVIGNWVTENNMDQTAADVFAPLVAAADRFPNLRHLFIGDVEAQQWEISWIKQSDLTPLLRAFPKLLTFGARGSENLGWEQRAYPELRELTFQCGGLPPEVVRAVAGSEFPELTDLELYLGTEGYFGGSDVSDLDGILAGTGLPELRYLGLRNAENSDEIAAAVAHAPIVSRLEVLDLSLGSLGDEGAAALLAGQPLTHLKKLDLHHHFLSEEMQDRLREALPGVEVDLSEHQEPDNWDGEETRFVSVAE
ncbi:STM4015 family protein [Catenulispora sp. NF23]|uniref:STM4015 family protein n=1 Tax=Catenulispora pinistramenti TaxID=2705254 RepID=UPI001BAD2B7E|nr:STM4015 family protein [Catenulispora pinistramenti]MBS2532269.1 STM4015 family protein [Catenulispora pinistramenti]